MAKLRDGQRDFSGGMVDRIAPERLGENQYAYGKNVEVRYGGVRSRRGSWRVRGPINDTNGDSSKTTGFHVFSGSSVDSIGQFIWASLEEQDSETYVRRSPATGAWPYTAKMATPETLDGEQSIRFVQGYNVVYAFRDGMVPWKWTGSPNDEWEYVPAGTSGDAPVARDGIYAYNRLWLIEGDDTVIPSDLLDENWDRTTNEFRVEQGDGTRLVALRPFGGGSLLAFKERGVALIRGAFNFAEAGDLSIEFVSDTVGCVAADTAVQVGADVFFLGRDGVWSIQQTSEQNARLVKVPLSEPIYGLIQDINWSNASRCSGAVYDNYYLVAVPVNGSSVPNRMLVFDLLLNTWVGFWEMDDGTGDPYAIAKIQTSVINGREVLLAIGVDGTINHLLKGEYVDYSSPSYTYYATSVLTTLTGRMSEFTDGYIEFRFRFYDASPGTLEYWLTDGFVIKIDEWDADTWRIYVASGSTFYIPKTKLPLGLGTYPFSDWHLLRLSHNDGATHLDINGEDMGTIYDSNDWLHTPATFIVGSNNPTSSLIDFDRVTIWTQRKASASATTPHRIHIPMDSSIAVAQNPVYFVYGASNTVELVQVANAPSFQSQFNDQANTDIESVLKTRGYDFGDILAAKSALRGELRFAHGQPSVTMEMGSDVPFDTETFASLNAKTYSLTNYEVVGRSAWDATNTNNDFQTPYREDYAPIAMGTIIGSAGLVLDRHREHTELFSSLAVFGWAQFTLTNTQGFVRYNSLSLNAQGRAMEQDVGNNGN